MPKDKRRVNYIRTRRRTALRGETILHALRRLTLPFTVEGHDLLVPEISSILDLMRDFPSSMRNSKRERIGPVPYIRLPLANTDAFEGLTFDQAVEARLADLPPPIPGEEDEEP